MRKEGHGGRRFALPAIFALTSVAAAALALTIAMGFAHEPGSGPVVTHPIVSMPAAKPARADAAKRDTRELREQLLPGIERALVSSDSRQRETAFNESLPKLLDEEPARVIDLVARQDGETRTTLRDEVVRIWIRKDRDAALVWMGSFENEWERKASATIAIRTLAAIEPAQAIAVADQFGVGRDDGSLEHMVQIWATEDLDGAVKWLETQPDNTNTAQLRARIEYVRVQRTAAVQ